MRLHASLSYAAGRGGHSQGVVFEQDVDDVIVAVLAGFQQRATSCAIPGCHVSLRIQQHLQITLDSQALLLWLSFQG